MSLRSPIWLLVFALCAASSALAADRCLDLVVTSGDGYANVRSQPKSAPGNLIGALPTGAAAKTAVSQAGKPVKMDGWYRLVEPFSGWIHSSQVDDSGCGKPVRVSADRALNAIERLARQGRAGDAGAAASFLALSRALDGYLADTYLDTMRRWALSDPESLAMWLVRQPAAIRNAAWDYIEIGLDTATAEQRERLDLRIIQEEAGTRPVPP
jgi:hypothetical protein